MTLESFAAELKKQRLDRQVSLMDISAATRISLKFLEALEEGNFAVLPQTYIRAFIREYAENVGMDPKGAMRKYDTLKQARAVAGPAEPAPFLGNVPAGKREEQTPFNKALLFAQENAVFLVLVGLALAFVVYLVRPTSDAATSTISEVPFDKVIQEHEAALPKKEDPIPLPVITKPTQPDSLRLEMVTLDSVWMTIIIDASPVREYLFPPNRKGSWIAQERFALTMGNAGGATFKLNGIELGALGRRGAVVRNVILSQANIPRQ